MTVTVGALVLGAAFSTVARQGRAYATLAAGVSARAAVRDAGDVTDAELRWAAPQDIRVATDSLVEVAAFVGAAVACASAGPSALVLPGPSGVASAWRSPPRAGDEIVFGAVGIDGRERERRAAIVGVVRATDACASSPFSAGAPDAFVVTFAAPVSDTLTLPEPLAARAVGTPVRILRATRLRYYASSSRPVLGVAEWEGGAWGTVQPTSGPYAARTGSSAGLAFRFIDSLGGATEAPRAVRAVTVTAISRVADYGVATAAGSAVVALRNGGGR